jgi:hypothetical protein
LTGRHRQPITNHQTTCSSCNNPGALSSLRKQQPQSRDSLFAATPKPKAFQSSALTSSSLPIELRWLNESQTLLSMLVSLQQAVSATTFTPQEVTQRLQRSSLRVCHNRNLYPFSFANTATGDISKASAKVKSEIPGRTKEAQKDAEKWASEAGSKVDSTVSDPITIPCKSPSLNSLLHCSYNPHNLTQVVTNSTPIRLTEPVQKLQKSNNTAKMPRTMH